MRLIDLFAHWRDQHLYDLQNVIKHLAGQRQLSADDIQARKIGHVSFHIDEQGRPVATRHETPLGDLIKRYIGPTGAGPVAVAPLLRTLRLERERRLRHLLQTARVSLARLMDPVEVNTLRELPALSPEPSAMVVNLLREASLPQAPRALKEYPATTLARSLAHPASQALLREVNAALGWYPDAPDRAALSVPDLAMLTLVLPLALDPDGDVHGFDFYAPALAGVSINSLLAAQQAHLMQRLTGCPDSAFGLIRYLLSHNAPTELAVLGLPDELAWATSMTWVLLSHGVTLNDAIIPGDQTLSFNEALELAAELAERDPGSRMSHALAAALAPALDRWRHATQAIANLPAPLTPAGAARAFLKHLDTMDRATSALQRAMPDRLQMAREELKKRGISPNMRFVHASDRAYQSLRSRTVITAFQAVASGLAAGESPPLVPALIVGHDTRLHEPWGNFRNIPDISARFEREFLRWTDDSAYAVGVLTERLLGDLPIDDRLRLEEHPSILCKLGTRAPSGDGEPALAHYGFVIYVDTAQGGFMYELVPSAAWCRIQADPQRDLMGTSRQLEKTFPFDWQAFASGSLPDPKAQFNGWLEPVAPIQAASAAHYRVFANARLMGSQCERQVAATLATLYPQARGTVPGETANPIPEELKALVPLWSSIEAIKQGVEEGRAWLVAFGVLGVGLELISLGALGRLSVLSVRFVTLALRSGARKATQLLAPRLRSAARDALDALIPIGADPQAPAPIADLGLILSIRSAHRALLARAARRLHTLSDAQRTTSFLPLGRLEQSAVRLKRLEDDTQVLVSKGAHGPSTLRLIDNQTTLPYGPVLDTIDDTGRLGRLPLELPVHVREGARYVPDPAPSLPKRWVRWGEQTWLECSGRYYRLRGGMATRPAALEQAPSPFGRPPLERPGCRVRRTLLPLVCGLGSERITAGFKDLIPDTQVPSGAVDWFDQRKILPDAEGRFVDGRRLVQTRPGKDQIIEVLNWDRYRDTLSVQRIAGNDIFQRIEVRDGLIEGVNDRRLLSAVQVRAVDTGELHLVTCVDEAVFYHGVVPPGADRVTLNKLPEGDSPRGDSMTQDEELKFLFNGCWDANFHIRRLGMEAVDSQLAIIEKSLAQNVTVSQLMSERFRLPTTPAQAALFAKYPRRSFVQQTRDFIASDYTRPLTLETPVAVREAIATHLNRLTEVNPPFDAMRVLDPVAIANAPPKHKNIAFLTLKYSDGRSPEVYYSVSGAMRRRTELALGKRATRESLERVSIAADGTRYINCRGDGIDESADALLHLPDLSQPSNLNSGDINDRRLDSERNILAGIRKANVDTTAVAEAALFTRFPTCDSCTALIAQFHEHLPASRFRVDEGPLPAKAAGGPPAPVE
jgi:hypothetical protein